MALYGADVLAAKPKSAALLLDWCSSRSKLAAPQVLLHLWRQEERRQGLCTEVGVLADVDWPLKPRKADEAWMPELSANVRPPGQQCQVMGVMGGHAAETMACALSGQAP